MVNGEHGCHTVHAQKLVVLDLKPELGFVTIRHHQMVVKFAKVLQLIQPLAITIDVQVRESRSYCPMCITNAYKLKQFP